MRFVQEFIRIFPSNKLLAFLALLAVAGSLLELGDLVWRLRRELRLPLAFYRHRIRNGLAVSFSALENQLRSGVRLPPMRILGVLIDAANDDWVVFGEAAPRRSELPLDTIAVAVRSVRKQLEPPGIDIQPQADSQAQQVSYFGGVRDTIVGAWFFRFDYWMKLTSLGQEPISFTGIPVYWRRAVEVLEREVQSCNRTGEDHWSRHNRYWLCTGEFRAIEGDDMLVFEETPLRVLAEKYSLAGDSASPCISAGTDDPLATEFAESLTGHLLDLAPKLPVCEIESFARILAGITWLEDKDPYRSLKPWLEVPLAWTETPSRVDTLYREAVRIHHAGPLVSHRHQLQLSGGVLIRPTLRRARSGDASLTVLYKTVLAARPGSTALLWSFQYDPHSPSSQQER